MTTLNGDSLNGNFFFSILMYMKKSCTKIYVRIFHYLVPEQEQISCNQE